MIHMRNDGNIAQIGSFNEHSYYAPSGLKLCFLPAGSFMALRKILAVQLASVLISWLLNLGELI
jgi:hypothetical protein